MTKYKKVEQTRTIYAFIDSQNLNLGVRSQDWKEERMNLSALAGQVSSFARRTEEKFCTRKIKKRGIPAGSKVPFGSPLIVIEKI